MSHPLPGSHLCLSYGRSQTSSIGIAGKPAGNAESRAPPQVRRLPACTGRRPAGLTAALPLLRDTSPAGRTRPRAPWTSAGSAASRLCLPCSGPAR